MDAQVVVTLLSGYSIGNMEGRSLLVQIRKPLHLDWRVRVTHIYREVNMIADGLAAMARDRVDGLQLFDDLPAMILQLLHADCNSVFTPRSVPI